MVRKKIVAAFDDHDFEQIVLLARMSKIPPSELIRKITKAYLDGCKVGLRGEEREG